LAKFYWRIRFIGFVAKLFHRLKIINDEDLKCHIMRLKIIWRIEELKMVDCKK